MKKCDNCGFVTEDGDYCPNCGTHLVEYGSAGTEKSRIKFSTGRKKHDDHCEYTKSASVESEPISSDSRLKRGKERSPSREHGEAETSLVQFKRSPRQTYEIPFCDVDLAPPPAIGNKPEINWLTTLLPAVASLSVAILVTVLLHNTMMLIYTLPMTIVGVIVSVLNYKKQTAKFQEAIQTRQENYTDYINKKIDQIKDKQSQQIFAIKQANPGTEECFSIVREREARMWERGIDDEDFLSVRVGTGEIDSCVRILVPNEMVSLEADDLRDKPREIKDKYDVVSAAPIICDLLESGLYGIVGKRNDGIALIRNMIVQIATHHCYSEVRIVSIYGEEDEGTLGWIKDLPHNMDDSRSTVYTAASKLEADSLFKQFTLIFEKRYQDHASDTYGTAEQALPFYVFVIVRPEFLEKSNPINEYLFSAKGYGVATIMLAKDTSKLPKQCKDIIFVNGSEGEIVNSGNYSKKRSFRIDDVHGESYSDFSKRMKPVVCEEGSETVSFPKTLTFLDMFGVKTIEELEPQKRWKKSNPVKSLTTPIGIAIDGTPFQLDLHEKQHGPHGLVAGTTGSGKSQFLLSYILSLAVNYHPDEVAFVLIDYKGGDMAKSFDDAERGLHLPHLAGIITNLDGATVQRSLMAIESELERRQRVFNSVRSLSPAPTMDIYVYQDMYRRKIVKEPLPHLFIISDEFAELKEQQPDFIDQLISASRIGRSLGIHLILATQKPAGIVNDQIRGNSRFKVCLMVNDKSDSSDVLQRPEAAYLKDKGRFYLQVGNNEVFEMGQSAWSGADYCPDRSSADSAHGTSRIRSTIGTKDKTVFTEESTQLISVVRMLNQIAISQNISERQLWENELPARIDIESLILNEEESRKKSRYSVPVAMVDDPSKQEQFEYNFDISKCHNLVLFGEAESGKSTFIQTLLLSITDTQSPEQFQFYVLDYSSRLLKAFGKMPHCGAVLGEEDNGKISSFFGIINGILSERKKLFSKMMIDNFETANSKYQIPLVVVVIDNYSGLESSKEGTEYGYKMPGLLKECPKYGIQFIITSSHLNDIPSRIRQEASNRICLHMSDKYGYKEGLNTNKDVNYLPKNIPGRGLCIIDERPLEIHFAMYWPNAEREARSELLLTKISEIAIKFSKSITAKRLPVISESATFEEFCGQFSTGRLPIGYAPKEGKTIALPLKQFSMMSVFIGNPEGTPRIIDNFLFSAQRNNMELWIVKAAKESLFDDLDTESIRGGLVDGAKIIEPKAEDLTTLWRSVSNELTVRQGILQDYCKEKGFDSSRDDIDKITFKHMYEQTSPIMILFENFADFCLATDNISSLIFSRIFQVSKKLNCYFIGFYKPMDFDRVKGNTLFFSFNQEENIILFGGQYDKQFLCDVPHEELHTDLLRFNVGIMKYQERYQSLLMPCGEVETDEIDPDDLPIF